MLPVIANFRHLPEMWQSHYVFSYSFFPVSDLNSEIASPSLARAKGTLSERRLVNNIFKELVVENKNLNLKILYFTGFKLHFCGIYLSEISYV